MGPSVTHLKKGMQNRILTKIDMNLKKTLLYAIFFLSGFARLDYTKVAGIQLFVIFSIFLIGICAFSSGKKAYIRDKSIDCYHKFLLWSFPALCIGVYFDNLDAIYFYLYTCISFLLVRYTSCIKYNFTKALYLLEISLLCAIGLGWLIYLSILPYDFLYAEVLESEFNLGYWGISYLTSSRNHDYMYPLTCASISLFLFKKTINKFTKYVQLLIFLICEVTLLASLSRGGMLISLLFMYFFIKGLSKREKQFSFIMIGAIIAFFFNEIVNQIETIFENIFLSIFGIAKEAHTGTEFSNNDRKDIYWNAINHIVINPFGYGIQNYRIITDYGGGSAENAYLTVLVERGWLAGVFFIKFLYYKWIAVWRSESREKSLNFYLLPTIIVYFLFNYEFTAFMCIIIFYLIMASDYYVNNSNCNRS